MSAMCHFKCIATRYDAAIRARIDSATADAGAHMLGDLLAAELGILRAARLAISGMGRLHYSSDVTVF